MPCRRSSSTMCSIIGRFTSGIIGLGWFEVRGRRRVPSPPAMITAFTSGNLPRRERSPCGLPLGAALGDGLAAERHVLARSEQAEDDARDRGAVREDGPHVLG